MSLFILRAVREAAAFIQCLQCVFTLLACAYYDLLFFVSFYNHIFTPEIKLRFYLRYIHKIRSDLYNKPFIYEEQRLAGIVSRCPHIIWVYGATTFTIHCKEHGLYSA